MSSRAGALVCLLLFVVAGLLYMSAGKHSRLVEDEQVVWQNPAVSGNDFGAALLGRMYDMRTESRRLARPVATLLLRAEHAAFRYQRSGFQWVNILLLGAVASVFFLLLRRQLGSAVGATVGALTLLAHPAATLTVLRMAGQCDLLAMLFGMLALWLVLPGSEKRSSHGAPSRRLWWMAAAFLLAGLSKEIALAIGPVLVAWAWLASRRRVTSSTAAEQDDLKQIALLVGGVALAVLLYRVLAIGSMSPSLRSAMVIDPLAGATVDDRIRLAFAAAAAHLRVLLFPLRLGYAYDWLYALKGGAAMAWVGAGVLAIIATAGIVYWSVRSGRETIAPWAVYSFCALVGGSGLFAPIGDFASERMAFFLLPAVIGLAVAGYLSLRRRMDLLALGVAIALVALFGVRTVVRSHDFMDRESYLRAQLETYPESAQGHYDKGNFFLEQGLWTAARSEYERVIAIRPNYWSAWVNLGASYFADKEPGLATRAYQSALEGVGTDPRFATVRAKAQFNRALVLMQQNRNNEAVVALLDCVSVYPNHLRAHANLGLIFANSPKHYAEAKEHLERAIELQSDPTLSQSLREKLAFVEKRNRILAERSGKGTPVAPDSAFVDEPTSPDSLDQ